MTKALPSLVGENNDESTPLPCRGGAGGGVSNFSYIEARIVADYSLKYNFLEKSSDFG